MEGRGGGDYGATVYGIRMKRVMQYKTKNKKNNGFLVPVVFSKG